MKGLDPSTFSWFDLVFEEERAGSSFLFFWALLGSATSSNGGVARDGCEVGFGPLGVTCARIGGLCFGRQIAIGGGRDGSGTLDFCLFLLVGTHFHKGFGYFVAVWIIVVDLGG